MRLRATTAFADQPAGRTGVDCQLALDVIVAADRAGVFAAHIEMHIETHSVVRAADVYGQTFACADVSVGTGECSRDREFNRRGVTPRRHQVAVEMHDASNIPAFGMMGVQFDRSPRNVGGKQRLQRLLLATRQLSQRVQQCFQSVGFTSQQLEGLNTPGLLRFEQRNSSQNRSHTIAQSMCHAAQQIVMYGQPAHRSTAVVRD